MNSGPAVLEIIDVRKQFRDVVVLDRVAARALAGSVTAFVGPNGAGKTTLFHVVSGDLHPDSGIVVFEGRRIDRKPAWWTARQGIGRFFQDARVFTDLSVEENIVLALSQSPDAMDWSRRFRALRSNSQSDVSAGRVGELLAEVGLESDAGRKGGELSLGSQRLLALARLRALGARCWLLDEPTAGLAPHLVDEFVDKIRQEVSETGITVMLIEHNLHVVEAVADKVYLLHQGQVVDHGTAREVLGNTSNRALLVGL